MVLLIGSVASALLLAAVGSVWILLRPKKQWSLYFIALAFVDVYMIGFFWVYWFVSRLQQDYIYALCVLLILILLPSVIFIDRWQGWYNDHVLKRVEAWLGPERKLLLWSFFWLCFTMGLMVVTPGLIAVAIILGLLKKI